MTTSSVKIVDITVWYKESVAFFVEVLSGGSRDKTLDKLGHDEIHHLQWLKNRDSNILKCSGFYFHYADSYVDHVTECQIL